jgi:hypothetical protein
LGACSPSPAAQRHQHLAGATERDAGGLNNAALGEANKAAGNKLPSGARQPQRPSSANPERRSSPRSGCCTFGVTLSGSAPQRRQPLPCVHGALIETPGLATPTALGEANKAARNDSPGLLPASCSLFDHRRSPPCLAAAPSEWAARVRRLETSRNLMRSRALLETPGLATAAALGEANKAARNYFPGLLPVGFDVGCRLSAHTSWPRRSSSPPMIRPQLRAPPP